MDIQKLHEKTIKKVKEFEKEGLKKLAKIVLLEFLVFRENLGLDK